MSAVVLCSSAGKTYTYQHLQGVMLVNLNKFAAFSGLSHAEYRLMGILIGHWNMVLGKAFPTIKELAKEARMSNSTVLKGLDNLITFDLLKLKREGKNSRNCYYLNNQVLLKGILTTGNNYPLKPDHVTACKNAIIKTKKSKTYQKKEQIDDIILNSVNSLIVRKRKLRILKKRNYQQKE